MSYAHEIFGIKENRNQLWMQDLLHAGVSSVTFNSDRMLEIASSPFFKENGVAGYYMLLWCGYNNVSLKKFFKSGQKVTVQNSDYGTADTYILTGIDTSAQFVSEKYIAYMSTIAPGSEYYDGNVNNTVIQSWLAAETPNWFSGITSDTTGLGVIVNAYGYAHGLPTELKELLKRNTVQPKKFYPVINNEPYFLYNTWYGLGVKNEVGYTAMRLIRMANPTYYSDPKFSIGHTLSTIIMPTSTTQNNAHPLLAPCWLENTDPYLVGSLENVNNSQVKNLKTNELVTMPTESLPKLTDMVPQLARFSLDLQ